VKTMSANESRQRTMLDVVCEGITSNSLLWSALWWLSRALLWLVTIKDMHMRAIHRLISTKDMSFGLGLTIVRSVKETFLKTVIN